MTTYIKIYYTDRLNRMYGIYPDEPINMDIQIDRFIMEYYDRTIKKRITFELLDKIINDYEIKINNIIITNSNKTNKLIDLMELFSQPRLEIYILLERKTIRDITGYNIMTNLLKYLLTEKDSYNIISEFSYNVQDIGKSKDMNIFNKNILQQTQHIHLPHTKKYKNINIILYDMVFFIEENANHEQIYNLIELDEVKITEFTSQPDKIKKFIKPSGKNIVDNIHYKNKEVARLYAQKLNSIFSTYDNTQITWYIVNYKNTFDEDKISSILERIEAPVDFMHVYGFSG
jgi:hypothetical protein